MQLGNMVKLFAESTYYSHAYFLLYFLLPLHLPEICGFDHCYYAPGENKIHICDMSVASSELHFLLM